MSPHPNSAWVGDGPIKIAIAQDCIRNPRERQQISDRSVVSASRAFANAFGSQQPEVEGDGSIPSKAQKGVAFQRVPVGGTPVCGSKPRVTYQESASTEAQLRCTFGFVGLNTPAGLSFQIQAWIIHCVSAVNRPPSALHCSSPRLVFTLRSGYTRLGRQHVVMWSLPRRSRTLRVKPLVAAPPGSWFRTNTLKRLTALEVRRDATQVAILSLGKRLDRPLPIASAPTSPCPGYELVGPSA